jgi:predicted acyl esterase
VFETPPFAAPVEIIGRVVAQLAVSATVPDFDLWVQLYDMAPDSTTWNLSSPGTALQRASYRDGGPERRLVQPGETVRLRIDRLVMANRFLPGHRLRVVITQRFYPLFSSTRRRGRRSSRATVSARGGDPDRTRGRTRLANRAAGGPGRRVRWQPCQSFRAQRGIASCYACLMMVVHTVAAMASTLAI